MENKGIARHLTSRNATAGMTISAATKERTAAGCSTRGAGTKVMVVGRMVVSSGSGRNRSGARFSVNE